jgi:hypothetical protein
LASASGSEPSGCFPHFKRPHMSAYHKPVILLLSILLSCIQLQVPAIIKLHHPCTSHKVLPHSPIYAFFLSNFSQTIVITTSFD